MPLSLKGRPDEDRAIRTIHAALDAGVNLIDTADAYAYDEADVGHDERLIAKALRGRRDGVLVATKGGHTRRGQAWELDGRPEHIRAACEASLRALETDVIDLYQFHRPDPDVPYAESIGAFRELQDEGKVRWVGVSNASVEQLEEALGDRRRRRACRTSSRSTSPSPIAKGEVACAERGIAFLPWSPLGGIGKADGTARRRAGARGRRGARRLAAAGRAGVAARARPAVIPIPGSSRPGDDRRLRAARPRSSARSVRSDAEVGRGDLGGGRRRLSGGRAAASRAARDRGRMRDVAVALGAQWDPCPVDVERRDLLRARQRAREAVLRGEPQDRAVPPAQREDGDTGSRRSASTPPRATRWPTRTSSRATS